MNWFKLIKEAFGQSCFIMGSTFTLLAVSIGIIKVIELGLDRLWRMGSVLLFSIPVMILGWYLMRTAYNNEWKKTLR